MHIARFYSDLEVVRQLASNHSLRLSGIHSLVDVTNWESHECMYGIGFFMQSFLLFADFQIKLKMFNATTNKIAVTINRQQINY